MTYLYCRDSMSVRQFLLPGLLAWLIAAPAVAQLRIVDYNTAGGPRAGISTIFEAIGVELVNGIAKAPDVVALQEQQSSANTTQAIVDLLNAAYGPGLYARATLDGATSGGGRPGLIYNTQTVQLVAQEAASTVEAAGAARETLRYQLRPVGYDNTADFYVYASHYKASDDAASAARRDVEAKEVRANADALGAAHILYAGDFNIYTSAEAMYQTLLAEGSGQAFDPLNRPGVWHDGASFKDIHTQSPATSARYAGQVLGGMDDRFDFQLVTAEFLDNEGLSYIPGSYRAFGNTNTHVLSGDITSGSATALRNRLPGYTTQQAVAVLEALASASDHLPVVADYQLPARMAVQLAAVPARVIRDATLTMGVTVTNTAPAVAVQGADELDYTLSASGGVKGTISGIDPAFGTGNTHTLPLETGTVGTKIGQVEVHSSSQGAANKDFSGSVAFSVLDHAKPFFAGNPEDTTLTFNFGELSPGSSSERAFSMGNWTSELGATAALDFDRISSSGQTGAFTLALRLFSNLAPGAALDFAAAFHPVDAGNFSASYNLFFSDEDLPGATELRTLNLHLIGTAIPEATPATLLLVGLLGAVGRRPRCSRDRRLAGS